MAGHHCYTYANCYLEDKPMPTQNARINVVLNDLQYQDIRLLAEKDNVSLSTKDRNLLKEALEIQEDIALSGFAEKREKSSQQAKGSSLHQRVPEKYG